MFLKMILITVVVLAVVMAALGLKMLLTKKQGLKGGCCSSSAGNQNSQGCACGSQATKC